MRAIKCLPNVGTEYMEVRCCCQPKKVLGWIPVDRELLRKKHELTFALQVPFNWTQVNEGEVAESQYEVINLPFGIIQQSVGFPAHLEHHWAIKSEETPIETLRKIREFVEA